MPAAMIQTVNDKFQPYGSGKVTARFGFPSPGLQAPNVASVMGRCLFLEDHDCQIGSSDAVDYIVVGSGCTALAFIDEALRLDPRKKILCLERGDFLLPTHAQNLPLPFMSLRGKETETFPWVLSEKTTKSELGYCHGYYPFFGGRSLFWSGWAPEPSPQALRAFPDHMKEATVEPGFWPRVRQLLRVVSADQIRDNHFGHLQQTLDQWFGFPVAGIPTIRFAGPALLAARGKTTAEGVHFEKFATPGPLLSLVYDQKRKAHRGEGEEFKISLNCVVEKILVNDDGVANGIQTSRGPIQWSDKKTKVILCAGTVPNTTLLLNSLPHMQHTLGKRLTGHFVTNIVARLPIELFDGCADDEDRLQIAAHSLLGFHPESNLQYQIQVTAIRSPHPEQDAIHAGRECPDYSATATLNQLIGSENHILFMFATLGETSEKNTDCWVRSDPSNTDLSTNIELQYLLCQEERDLWHFMDEATYDMIDVVPHSQGQAEYWNDATQSWQSDRLPKDQIRVQGVVHEASTAFVGPEEEGGSLDNLYRPHGCKNMFVTGAAVFPTAGGWNPTTLMCGYAQDLARKLHRGDA